MSNASSKSVLNAMSPTVIGQFNKERIAAILPEVMRQKEAKRDFVFPSPKLSVDDGGRLVMSDLQLFQVGSRSFTDWNQAESFATARKAQAGEMLSIVPVKTGGPMTMNRTAHRQLCNKTGVPVDYIDRLNDDGQSDLSAYNLSQRLARSDEKLLVRTLDGNCRAVLSNSYRTLDNADLFFAAHDVFESVNAELWQMRLWDNGFDVLAVAKGISGKVTTDRTFDPGDGWSSRWANLDGDVQYAAIRITNSETGGGALGIAPAVMTRVCANFQVWAKSFRGIHVQRQREEEGLLISDEARAAEDKMIWLKVRDAIKTVFDPARFEKYIAKMNNATQVEIGDKVEKTVDNVLSEYQISEERKSAILKALCESRDYSQYGLAMASTFVAHHADREGAEDVASDLEAVGGDILEMTSNQFAEMRA